MDVLHNYRQMILILRFNSAILGKRRIVYLCAKKRNSRQKHFKTRVSVVGLAFDLQKHATFGHTYKILLIHLIHTFTDMKSRKLVLSSGIHILSYPCRDRIMGTLEY